MCTINSRWLFWGIMLTKHYPPITTAGPYLPCINLPCTHAGWGNTTKSYQIPTRNKGLKPYSSAMFLILFCYFLTHPGGVEKGTYIWIYICAHIHVSSHDHVYNIIYILIHLVLTVEKITNIIHSTFCPLLQVMWEIIDSDKINRILLKRSRQRNVDPHFELLSNITVKVARISPNTHLTAICLRYHEKETISYNILFLGVGCKGLKKVLQCS